MDISPPDNGQTMQRVKVGMTGLALVLLLIALASALFSSASTDKPADVAGGSKAAVVANLSITNDSAGAEAAKPNEPLAELGVAPSAPDANSTAPANQTSAVPPVTVPIQPIQTQPQR